jgi:hypothetical protein
MIRQARHLFAAAVAVLVLSLPLQAATNPKLTNTAANAAIDAIAALANNGYLDIYNGTQPATADTAISSQTLLASLHFSNPAFGAGSAGVATAAAISSDSDADATGTATWFRVFKSDHTTAVWDGSVGTSSADLVLGTTSIVQHAIVSVSSYTITQNKG